MPQCMLGKGLMRLKQDFISVILLYMFVMLSYSVTLGPHSINDLVVVSNLHEWSACQQISYPMYWSQVVQWGTKHPLSASCCISCSLLAKAGSQISKTNQMPKVTFVIHNSWAPVSWLSSALHGLSVSVCICLDW